MVKSSGLTSEDLEPFPTTAVLLQWQYQSRFCVLTQVALVISTLNITPTMKLIVKKAKSIGILVAILEQHTYDGLVEILKL